MAQIDLPRCDDVLVDQYGPAQRLFFLQTTIYAPLRLRPDSSDVETATLPNRTMALLPTYNGSLRPPDKRLTLTRPGSCVHLHITLHQAYVMVQEKHMQVPFVYPDALVLVPIR